jgi:two-component system chemotaxis response regulator CheB
MPHHSIIAVGASAGGIEALSALVVGLPEDLKAAIFIVLHVSAERPSILPHILQKHSRLPVAFAEDEEEIKSGHIYVAPPDYHLILEGHQIRLTHGPREHFFRPAINPLFRSVAISAQERAIGIVLTGMLDDGTSGLWEIKRHGGLTVVQNPAEAAYPSMPESALANVEVDYKIGIKDMPGLLMRLVEEEVQMSETVLLNISGIPTDMTCPDCRGALSEYRYGKIAEYRCRVGHAHSALSLIEAHREAEERALWAALVAVEEAAELAASLAKSTRSEAYVVESGERMLRAQKLRQLIETIKASPVPERFVSE